MVWSKFPERCRGRVEQTRQQTLSCRMPHPTFRWLGGRGYFRAFSGPYRPHIRSRFFPHIRKGRECVGHPRGRIIGQGVGSRDQTLCLCPRFASFLWTLTWAEEDSGRAAENFQFTISGCPLRFDLHHSVLPEGIMPKLLHFQFTGLHEIGLPAITTER